MKHAFITLLLTLFISISQADVLELADGQLLNGTYEGGTAGTIRFEVNGEVQIIPVDAVLALTISRSGSSSAPTVAAAPMPVQAAPAQAQELIVPAGTPITVTLRSDLTTRSARAGQKFDAALATDLMAGAIVLAPRGSLVRGTITAVKPPRRVRKAAMLAFTLDEIVLGGNSIRISTNINKTETGPDGSIIKGAAAGAIIGEIADNDAGRGAEIGAAAGAMKKGDHIVYRAGSNVTFQLTTNVTLSQ